MRCTFVGYLALLVCLLFAGSAKSVEEDLGERNIRLRNRTPGVYLTPTRDAESPERHNFTTSLEPLAELTPEAIEKFIVDNPDLKDYRIVLIGPSVGGDEANQFKEVTRQALDQAGLPSEVEIIRHPKGLKERLLNLIPRREDYEPPIAAELKVAAWKILVAESLSFAVLLVPPLLKGSEGLAPEISALIDQIALPLKVAIPMVVLDIAHMIPLVSYRRSLSNHNIRLTPLERFNRQFLLSMFFSFNFYAMSQWPAIADGVANLSEATVGGTAGALGKMLSIIVPASAFNMLSRTTVGTSLNIWEQRKENRRFMVAILEAVTGVVIAPIYILSTMPVLKTVVETPVMNLNAAHLSMLSIGVAGGIAWAMLEKVKLKSWAKRTWSSCAAMVGSLFGRKAKPGT